jgi:hypothetical protein
MSWIPQVIADASEKFVGNSLRYATKAESDAAVADLFQRWTLVTDTRSVESLDPVNAVWDPLKGTVLID